MTKVSHEYKEVKWPTQRIMVITPFYGYHSKSLTLFLVIEAMQNHDCHINQCHIITIIYISECLIISYTAITTYNT